MRPADDGSASAESLLTAELVEVVGCEPRYKIEGLRTTTVKCQAPSFEVGRFETPSLEESEGPRYEFKFDLVEFTFKLIENIKTLITVQFKYLILIEVSEVLRTERLIKLSKCRFEFEILRIERANFLLKFEIENYCEFSID